MGDKSGIEWCDATWNWVVGCTPVSAGCDHCYAKTLHDKRHRAYLGGTFPDAPKQYHEPFEAVQLIPGRLDMPLRWTKPRKIFVNSLADVFHKDVPDELIDRAFAVMALTKRHTFQILTKRPQRMQRYLADPALPGRISAAVNGVMQEFGNRRQRSDEHWPLPNVWLGVSVEDQAAAFRIDALIKTPATVRFLSCEPLIDELDLAAWLPRYDWRPTYAYFQAATGCAPDPVKIADGVDWVIVGGESGTGHRPLDLDWVRSLRDQCIAARVPFLFKQVGGHTAKAGGRELDGRTWDEFPAIGGAE